MHLFLHGASAQAETTRVSVDSIGNEGNDASFDPSISADGRFVAFSSVANNLVPGDTNGARDIFVHDLQTGQTTRVSVDSMGNEANGTDDEDGLFLSQNPSISGDGRFVAFDSAADNLIPGISGRVGVLDVFVHDRQTGQTTRVSVDSMGNEANGPFSFDPSISADGRFVAFVSDASNLAPGDTNETQDVFVHDRQTGQTTRVSVDSMGNEANEGGGGPSISADGRFVAFDSESDDLVPGDTNEIQDVFVHDRQTGQTTRVSVESMGNEANGFSMGNGDADDFSIQPSISADGRFVAFSSSTNNLVPRDTNGGIDIFVHDRQTGQTTRVSVDSMGNEANSGNTFLPSISGDGRVVAFSTDTDNLVPGDTNGAPDIFVHDRQTGQTTRVSVDRMGNEANSFSSRPSISGDGRVVAFDSDANNLVPRDGNRESDIFVRGLGTRSRRRTCNCQSPHAILGGPNNDRLRGTAGDDIICGFGGDDRLLGKGGNDCLDGGAGHDRLLGGHGNDVILGQGGRDDILGETGDDDLRGGDGDDVVSGGKGNDVIRGNDGRDTLSGDAGDDELRGGHDDDLLFGGRGNDDLRGGGGRDTCIGGRGTDRATACQDISEVP